MSAENIILLSSRWHTEEESVGLTAVQITKPSSLKNVATVMIHADPDNTGVIAFGHTNAVTLSTNLGGKLDADRSCVLPINLVDSQQELYLISSVAAQTVYVSYFTGGDIC